MSDKTTESKELNMKERLIDYFQYVEEANFYPENIENTLNTLMSPTTFSELDAIMDNNQASRINKVIDTDFHTFVRNYSSYLKELERMRNVFSFDIDYI